MKVALINPPMRFSKSQYYHGIIPPLGIMYLAASLRRSGHVPVVVDSFVEGYHNTFEIGDGLNCRGLDFPDIVSRIDPDVGLIGISNLFSFTFPVVEELTKEIKKSFPNIPIAVGGAHPSATPEKTISVPTIDFVGIGESDLMIVDLVNGLYDPESIKNIAGLAYKDGEGNPRVNPRTGFIEDLDSLPFPARDLLPLEKYYSIGDAHGPSQYKWTPAITSRGCPFNCSFCTTVEIWKRRYRTRSAENVLAEIKECIDKFGITEFHFEDDNFTMNKQRVLDICRRIKEWDIGISWQTPNGILASTTDEEMLVAMKDSGCTHITVAPESGSEIVLKEIIKKPGDLESIHEIVGISSRIGLRTAAFFIFGFPGETLKDAEMTIDYACKLAKAGLDEAIFGNFTPLPGAELFRKLVKEGKYNEDLNILALGDFGGRSWSEHISSKELSRLMKKALVLFYLTRMVCRPLRIIRSVFNVIRMKQELKSERVAIAFIRRLTRKYIFR